MWLATSALCINGRASPPCCRLILPTIRLGIQRNSWQIQSIDFAAVNSIRLWQMGLAISQPFCCAHSNKSPWRSEWRKSKPRSDLEESNEQ